MTATDHNVAGLVALAYAGVAYMLADTLETKSPWLGRIAALSALLLFGTFIARTFTASWIVLVGRAAS